MGKYSMGKYVCNTIADEPVFEAAAATIYHQGGFGYTKLEAKKVAVFIGKYAQYPHAVQVLFIEKGKRKPKGFKDTHKPSTVILEGHGHPNAPSPFKKAEESNGFIVSASKHSMFAEEYGTEFDDTMDPYFAKDEVKVLSDYRQHNSLREE